jgi:hypothetical protein
MWSISSPFGGYPDTTGSVICIIKDPINQPVDILESIHEMTQDLVNAIDEYTSPLGLP